MEIRVVDNTKHNFEEVVPSFLLGTSLQEDEIIIVAIEEGTLLGFAMFEMAPLWPDVINLDFIYTDKAARDKMVASKILAYAEHYFKDFGIRSISMKTCGTKEFLKNSFNFLVAEEFYPIALAGHLVEYELSDIFDSNFNKKIDSFEPLFKNVLKAKDVPKELVLAMLNGNEDARDEAAGRSYDLENSYFYLENNKIKGAIFTEIPDEKTIFVVGSFLSPEVDNKIIMPALIGSLIKGFSEFSEDTRVLIQCFIENEYKGVITQFGKPRTEYLVQEYIKHLMSLEQDRLLEGEKTLNIKQIKERTEFYEEQFTIPLPAEESYKIYEKYVPKGDLYDKCLGRFGYRFLSEYGLRRARLLAYMDLGVPTEHSFKQIAEEYRAEVVAWYESIGKVMPTGTNKFTFFRRKKSFENASMADLERYINEIDIPWSKGTIIFYYLQQLFDCYFTEIVNKYKDILPEVEQFENNLNMSNQFQYISDKKKIGFDKETFDKFLSCYYVQKNEILGAIWVERLDENIIMVHEPYISEKCSNNFVPVALIWKFLELTRNELGEETKIGFGSRSEGGVSRYQMYFGRGYRQLAIKDEISPEGIRLARVSEDYREEAHVFEWEELKDKSLEELKEMAKNFDDKAIISYHHLINNLEEGKLKEIAAEYYDSHRGLRYSKADNNRKKLAKQIIQLLDM